jgi:transposase InsO family protein
VKYAWIKAHGNTFSSQAMCQFMEVSRSSYYDWLKTSNENRDSENEHLIELLKPLFEHSRRTYGTRRLKSELRSKGFVVSRRRIGRLMEKSGLKVKTKKKYKVTTDSKHKDPISPNLLQRQFDVDKPDGYYVGDITYIKIQGGWLYLAVVIDLYSRKVVGWSMDTHMTAELVNDALLSAVWKRKPAKGLVWHTDRGSQYASKSHRKLIKRHHITQSMSRKGNCWDKAVSESFFHTLKNELIHGEKLKTRAATEAAVFEYIEVFYNRQRIHSANGYLSSVYYEARQLLEVA